MLNPFYNNHAQNGPNTNEWSLVNGLIAESIQIRGMEVYYLPRKMENFNQMLGEDIRSKFDVSIPIEMIPGDPAGFSGTESIAKFGIDILNDIQWYCVISRLHEELNKYNIDSPAFGDLIYLPMANIVFKITHYEDEKVPYGWYPLGKPMMYVFDCVMFDYEHEEFNTGIESVDALNTLPDLDPFTTDNEVIQQIADELIEFSENEPFAGR